MNSLSWLIYFSNIVQSIGVFFVVLCMLGLFGGVCLIIAYVIDNEEAPPLKVFKTTFIALAFGFIACFIPTKDTVMYIAASEYGEKLVNSKDVQDLKNPAMDLLKKWMQNEIERLSKESNK